MHIFPPFSVNSPAVPLDVTSEQIDYFPHPCVHSCRAIQELSIDTWVSTVKMESLASSVPTKVAAVTYA